MGAKLKVLAWAAASPEVLGAVVIAGDRVGAVGQVELGGVLCYGRLIGPGEKGNSRTEVREFLCVSRPFRRFPSEYRYFTSEG